MLSQLFEQNKEFLERRKSYMLPHFNKINCMLNNLEKSADADYFDAFERKQLRNGEYLLKEGNICKHVWFLEKGLARTYGHKEEQEVTQYFFSPAEAIDSIYSSSLEIPSLVNIQLIRDSVVYSISHEAINSLAIKYPEISKIAKLLEQSHDIWQERRLYNIKHSSAMEQYLIMMDELAPIINFISCNHKASYLGITIETLSRVRKRFALAHDPLI